MKGVHVVAVLLILSGAAFAYMTYFADTPSSPPTWGYTKIAHATIGTKYYEGGATMSKVTYINLSINVKKQYEVKTVEAELYSNGTQVAWLTYETTISGKTAIIKEKYSDSTAKINTSTTVILYTTLDTPIGITMVSSSGDRTYYGTYDSNTITYTFTYAGHSTWIGYYSTVITYPNQTLTGVYTATIVQK